jgi:chorismate mutase / prephenate dehydratase
MTTTPTPKTPPAQPGENGASGNGLDQARKNIDRLDREILKLLNRRAAQAKDIAWHKAADDQPLFIPEREAAVMDALCQENQGPLESGALRHIFREIISACRQVQRPLRVAFLGPEQTFSHQAALSRFGGSCDYAPQASIAEVFEEVEAERSPLGVVPVENSSQGGVTETLDRLMDTQLTVCGEIYARVGHMLMSREGEFGAIKRVYSHPQALSQCRGWLRRKLPQAQLIDFSSTAAAASQAVGEAGSAAVGSRLTAQHNDLPILAADIQDIAFNSTRFLVLGQRACPATGRDKTSLIFGLSHRPGSLSRILEQLAKRDINLTHIQSRPIKQRPWEYAFFVDCLGHRQDLAMGQAIEALRGDVEYIKVLGSYPQGQPLPDK